MPSLRPCLSHRAGLAALLAALTGYGCKRKPPPEPVPEAPARLRLGADSGTAEHSPPVVGDGLAPVVLEADDAQMNAAHLKARQMVGEFLRVLERPEEYQENFMVKARFTDQQDPTRHEWMWVYPVRYAEGRFLGTLDNEPTQILGPKKGQPVALPIEELGDWLYFEDERVVGGFTLRVMREQMSPEQRALFDHFYPLRDD